MKNLLRKTIVFSTILLLILLLSSKTHSFASKDWHDYQEKFIGDLSEKNIQADSLEIYEEILIEQLSEENIEKKALSQEEMFQLEIETLNLEEFDDNMLRCLCRAACDDAGWRCGVVTCMYSPKPSNESPGCAKNPGVCKCVGFGCGRASIGFTSERAQNCFKTHGNPLEVKDERGQELKNLDEDIEEARNHLLVLIRAQQLGGKSQRDVEGQLKKLTGMIEKRIKMRMEESTDLNDQQKEKILEITNKHLNSYKVNKVGDGSRVQTSCRFLWYWCKDTLEIDPSSSTDIIYHELGHLIYEELSPNYQHPTGSSEHDFARYSASEHVALDEALATFIAMYLKDSTSYGSIDPHDEIMLDSKDEKYFYDFKNKKLFVSNPSDVNVIEEVSESNRGLHVRHFGNDELKEQAEQRIEEINKELEDIAAQAIHLSSNSNRNRYPRLYTKEQIEKYKNSPEVQDERKLTELRKKAESLKREKDRIEWKVNPPAYSPKGELSVTRLLFELTGGVDERDKLGEIMEATENFTKVKGRGPTTELELLQGFLHGKDSNSEEFKNALEIIQSDDFRRKYDVESLILKQ